MIKILKLLGRNCLNGSYYSGILNLYQAQLRLAKTLMEPVLKAATAKKIGVTIMNPLAGELIPQNKDFF